MKRNLIKSWSEAYLGFGIRDRARNLRDRSRIDWILGAFKRYIGKGCALSLLRNLQSREAKFDWNLSCTVEEEETMAILRIDPINLPFDSSSQDL